MTATGRRQLLWLVAAVVGALVPLSQPKPGWAQAVLSNIGSRDAPVTIDADELSYERGQQRLRAEGDVVITQDQTLFAADRVVIERDTQEVVAEGDFVLEDAEGRVRAERARIELEDETGFLEEGEVYLPHSRFLLGGKRLEKGIGQSYRIWDGQLTTCECEEGVAPDWSIRGNEVDIELGGWGVVRGGVFRVKDVPVLYLPYAFFPIQRERQSGLLMPRFGFSNVRGFQYVQPFYWAIDKSQDLTLSLDVETSARLGLLAEYRYAIAPGQGGVLTASYFNERIRGDRRGDVIDESIADPTIPENRWSVIGHHEGFLEGGARYWVRPFVVSDSFFLREMNTLTYLPASNLITTTQRYTTSEVGIQKTWRWGRLLADARYFQDLIQKQSRQPQPLPRILFNGHKRLFDGKVRLTLNTHLVNYVRGPLAAGPRLHIEPGITIPYRLGPYGGGRVQVRLQETLYYLLNNELQVGFEREDGTVATRAVRRFQHRETLFAQAEFESEVSRVYEVGWGRLQKLKHTIEPFVRYLYSPVVDQEDLPLYDAFVDRLQARNLFLYGFRTRLLGKFGVPAGPDEVARSGRVRELGRIKVQNGYSLRPLPIFGSTDTTRWSTIDLEAKLTPVEYAGAHARASYSVARSQVQYAQVGAHLVDPRPLPSTDEVALPHLRPVNSVSASYQFTDGAVENLNLAGTLRLSNRLAMNYLGRFDAREGRFLENWAGLRIISNCDCWVLDFAVIDRVNPDELQFRVLFSLVGLGSVGQSPFRQGFGTFGLPQLGATPFGAPQFGAPY